MRNLLRYLKDYKKECTLAPLFKLIEACFELAVPLVVASLIDRGIGHSDRPYIYKMFALLVFFAFFGFAIALISQYFSAKAATGFAFKLRRALFSHIQSLSYSDLDYFGVSKLITRISGDVTQVQTGVNLTLRLIMRAPFVVFGAVIMAFTVDAHSAAVFCAMVPLLIIAVSVIMSVGVPLYKRVQSRLDGVTSSVRENLVGARVLRAFAKEEDEREDFSRKNKALYRASCVSGRVSALLNPLTYAIVNISVAVLIYVGAVRVNVGAISQGAVVALYNYMAQILIELVKMANLIITMTKAFASASRINEVFEKKTSMKNGTVKDIGNFDIVFDNVSLTYPGAKEASLSDVTFTAKRGEKIGIIGSTGSGKTSLVNLVARLYDVTDGSLTLGGRNIKEYDLDTLRSSVGTVPQKAVLFSGTVRDNIRAGREDISDDDIYDALGAAQALEVVNKKEKGLDEEVEQGGRNFSGGQRQRLTIARALAKKPPILILDDSASALDYATDAALRSAISNLGWAPTVFIVSQRASSVMGCDKIIVLDDGKICGMGNHGSLMDTCAEYEEIYYSQFEREQIQ